jgi:hypothetical protein
MPHDEEWRILAEEAALEKDPNKLLEIVSALNRALDEREKQKTMATRGRQNGDMPHPRSQP